MPEDTKIKVMFFPNGRTAAFRGGEQVSDLQESWFSLFLGLLAACEIDPTTIEFVMPDARRAEVFATEDNRYNWRILARDK